jgi:hypothetical protein
MLSNKACKYCNVDGRCVAKQRLGKQTSTTEILFSIDSLSKNRNDRNFTIGPIFHQNLLIKTTGHEDSKSTQKFNYNIYTTTASVNIGKNTEIFSKQLEVFCVRFAVGNRKQMRKFHFIYSYTRKSQ